MVPETLLAGALLFAPAQVEASDSTLEVEVKVTQKYLVPLCLDGRPVESGDRRWKLASGSHSLAFTMRNSPRTEVPGAEVAPGFAVVGVVLEAGHEYEVEIRAPETTFSSRVWKEGEWKPVVRNRTTDRIVSGEPEWKASGCES
jgi:hypothetical protein